MQAVVGSERALRNVAVRVLASVMGVGALLRSLVEVPEGLNSARVNVTVHVLASVVVNGRMVLSAAQPAVVLGTVGEEGGTGFDPVTNAGMNFLARNGVSGSGHDLTTALGGTLNGDLALATWHPDHVHSLGHADVLQQTTDVRLIGLHRSRQLLKGSARHRQVADGLDERKGEFRSGVVHESINPKGCDIYISPINIL